MKFAIILQSNTQERVWNTFRFGIFALKAGHTVEVFLLNEGADLDSIPDSDAFNISDMIAEFKKSGGTVSACRTCMVARGKGEGSNVCDISSMPNMLKLVENADKVMVF